MDQVVELLAAGKRCLLVVKRHADAELALKQVVDALDADDVDVVRHAHGRQFVRTMSGGRLDVRTLGVASRGLHPDVLVIRVEDDAAGLPILELTPLLATNPVVVRI